MSQRGWLHENQVHLLPISLTSDYLEILQDDSPHFLHCCNYI
jgi:hypothetical protein